MINIVFNFNIVFIFIHFKVYYEFFHNDFEAVTNFYVAQPTGLAAFKKELFVPPRSFTEYFYNVISYNILPTGGHFAAWEGLFIFCLIIFTFFFIYLFFKIRFYIDF